MKEKKYFITISLLLFSLTLSAYNISQDDAVSIVQQYRSIPNDHGRFYVAGTDSLINNWACNICVIPEEEWTNGTSPMWLVFVDEQPNNSMWSHPCVYYYVPQQWSSIEDIPVIGFRGSFAPQFVSISNKQTRNVQRRELTIDEENAFFNDYMLSTTIENKNPDRLKVVIIAGEYEDESYGYPMYNDTKRIYKVLRHFFNIPKRNFYVLLGSGGKIREDSCAIISSSLQTDSIICPMDLDDDGILDVYSEASKEAVEYLFNYILADNLTKNDHLLVIVDTHGEENKGLHLWHEGCYNTNCFLAANELNSLLEGIDVASECFIINSCFSGQFIQPLKKNGRIILTSSDSQNESWGDDMYNKFIHLWTNAVVGLSCNNTHLPFDNMKWESMYGAFLYSSEDNNYQHRTGVSVREANPKYYSSTFYLGDSWGINHLPDANALLIKDNDDDLGEDGNPLLPSARDNAMAWESPDIWLRKHNDGNENYEPIVLTNNDSTIYVYVRVKNVGYKTYADSTRYLHLHWNYPSFRHNTASWTTLPLPTSVLPNAHELPPLQIPNCIDTTSTQIICFKWRLPQELRDYAAANNGNLAIDIMARISDSRRYAYYDTDALLYPFYYSSAVDVLRQPNVAESCIIQNGTPDSPISFNASLFTLSDDTQLKIKAMRNIPSFITLRLSGTSFGNVVLTNGNNEIDLSTLTHGCSETININCSVDILRQQRAQTVTVPIALLGSDGMELGGFTLKMHIGGNDDNTLEPGIDDSVENGEIDDEGEIDVPVFGPRMLSMSNITEPVSCRWTDCHGNLLGEGRSLQIPYNVSAEYTLTVSALKDNATAFVTKQIEPTSLFKLLYKSGDELFIELKQNAPDGTAIVLRSAVNNSIHYSYKMHEGTNSLSLSTSNIKKGNYLVSIYVNGELIETKQIIL